MAHGPDDQEPKGEDEPLSGDAPRQVSLQELGQRLDKARGSDQRPEQTGSAKPLGVALRMSTEFTAAIVVGAGIGWFLDQWLGTWPWLFVVFFCFGTAAGFVNVIRAANELGMGSGSKGGPDET